MTTEEARHDRSEIAIGITLALLAAVMTFCNMAGGRFSYYFTIASQKQTESLSWYQSKSIKQSLVEGQRDMLASQHRTGMLTPGAVEGATTYVAELDAEITRYRREKEEILRGSAAVGKENWAQAVDGKLGNVKGAQEWQAEATKLGDIGGLLESATLYLQMALVFGAIALLFRSVRARWIFFFAMSGLGTAGSYYTLLAFAAF